MRFEKRSRRPSLDAFNACINYAYGMLYNTVETSIITAGLDPEMGIFHKEQLNKPTLVYDLIEPFRPWTDRVVIDLFLNRKIPRDCFEDKEEGVWLGQKGKAILIPSINEHLIEKTYFNQKRIKRKDQINHLALELAQMFYKLKY